MPTLLAAALRAAGRAPGGRLAVSAADLRQRLRERRPRRAVAFVLDASSSMRRDGRLGRAKALVRDYLHECHLRRDRVAVVAFRHDRSRLVCPFTDNTTRALRSVVGLEMGGRTPLAEGLALGLGALERERLRDPCLEPVLVVLSDGRPNLSVAGGHPFDEAVAVARRAARAGAALVFLDTEDDPMASGCGHAVALAGRGTHELAARLFRRRPTGPGGRPA